jgi:hypothetical protein
MSGRVAVVDLWQMRALTMVQLSLVPPSADAADCGRVLFLHSLAVRVEADGARATISAGWTADWAVNASSPAYIACDAAAAALTVCLNVPITGTGSVVAACTSSVGEAAAAALTGVHAFAGLAAAPSFGAVRTRDGIVIAASPANWLPSGPLSALLAVTKKLDIARQPSIARTFISAAIRRVDAPRIVLSADGADAIFGPPIAGGWTAFSAFSPCNTSCGSGVTCRSRSCSQPFPEQGGAACSGLATECVACAVLPVVWEAGAWGRCEYPDGRPVTCDVGTQRRTLLCRQCTGLEVLPSLCRDVPRPAATQACDVFGPWAWKPFSSSKCKQTACGVGYYPTTFKCWSTCNDTQVRDEVCSVFPAPAQPSCAVIATELYEPYAWVVAYGSCTKDGCRTGYVPTTVGDCQDCRKAKVLNTTLCGARPSTPRCDWNDVTRAPFSWGSSSWRQTNSGCCKTFERTVKCYDCGWGVVDDGYCTSSKPKTTCETTDGGCSWDPLCWFDHATNC